MNLDECLKCLKEIIDRAEKVTGKLGVWSHDTRALKILFQLYYTVKAEKEKTNTGNPETIEINRLQDREREVYEYLIEYCNCKEINRIYILDEIVRRLVENGVRLKVNPPNPVLKKGNSEEELIVKVEAYLKATGSNPRELYETAYQLATNTAKWKNLPGENIVLIKITIPRYDMTRTIEYKLADIQDIIKELGGKLITVLGRYGKTLYLCLDCPVNYLAKKLEELTRLPRNRRRVKVCLEGKGDIRRPPCPYCIEDVVIRECECKELYSDRSVAMGSHTIRPRDCKRRKKKPLLEIEVSPNPL